MGGGWRRWFAKRIMLSCADTANIERNAHFGPQVSIGERSSIGVSCALYGPVSIGNDVMMGPEVVIFTSGHAHSRTDIPMIEQGSSPIKPVAIEDDVWIGQRCMIMPGVRIAKGCVIAAGAVITRDTAPFGIYAGVPAKRVKSRLKE